MRMKLVPCIDVMAFTKRESYIQERVLFVDIDPNICLSTTNDSLANQTKYYNIPDFNNIKLDLGNVSILVTNISCSFKHIDNFKNALKLSSEMDIHYTYRLTYLG